MLPGANLENMKKYKAKDKVPHDAPRAALDVWRVTT